MEENKDLVDINVFLKDPTLVTKINVRINEYTSRRNGLPENVVNTKFYREHNNIRFRRTAEDRIIDDGNFNAMWFIDEFLKTISKTSSLPKAIRECVETYVVTAMQELYYENLKKNKDVKEESGSESPNAE